MTLKQGVFLKLNIYGPNWCTNIEGLWLAKMVDAWSQPWFHAKFTLVIVMFAIHGMLSKYRKNFVKGENQKSETYFRVINEVPAVLMILIVILVVVKPF